MRMLLEKVGEEASKYDTFVVAGDFNACRGDDGCFELLEGAGFTDSAGLAKGAGGREREELRTWTRENQFMQGVEGEKDCRIDFVFVRQRRGLVKGSHSIAFGKGKEVSDHFGVKMELFE